MKLLLCAGLTFAGWQAGWHYGHAKGLVEGRADGEEIAAEAQEETIYIMGIAEKCIRPVKELHDALRWQQAHTINQERRKR